MKGLSSGIKVGILVIAMLVGGYVVWKSIGTNPAGSDNYDLWAKFRDASGMPVGSKVVIAGLPVGEITQLSIEGRYAKVTFRVRDDVTVWSNAVVYKKSTSLLGDHYLEIDPGDEAAHLPDGRTEPHTRLGENDQIKVVVEATSPDQLLRRVEDTLPNVDEVLRSVKDLSEDVRRLVNGPLASVATRVDDLVQTQSKTVTDILAKADASMDRVDAITKDLRAISSGADQRIDKILENLDQAGAEARGLVASAKKEVEDTGAAVRQKLDLVDDVVANADSITKKIDTDQGTLGRLVNDPAIADNVEQITDDAKGFLGTLFSLQAYVGLRSEYNVLSGGLRNYVSVELHTRPDKFYLFEIERGPRGNYPDTELTFDPTIDPNNWIRTSVIKDASRFTFQFAKRLDWLTLRYGIKESSGGIGADADVRWWDQHLTFSADVFDASFDTLPRVKLAAAIELFRYAYILGGIDEALNPSRTLPIVTGNTDVPTQFSELHYGRDYFFGGMLRFNDDDLAALLTVGGSALTGVAK